MKLDYKHLIPGEFAPDSRVWIYQSNRIFSVAEAFEIEDMVKEFVESWKSHGVPVKGYGNLFFGQFVVLMADENATGISGCSTDSSVRMIKAIETRFNVNMFERQLLAFVVKDKIQLLPLSQLNYALENNLISPDTIYFHNLVQTKEELLKNWLVTVKDSWLAGRVLKTES
jgi:hypothetical protein